MFHDANLAINSDVDQDTLWKKTKHNKHDSQEVSPFSAGDKATRNRHNSANTNMKHIIKSSLVKILLLVFVHFEPMAKICKLKWNMRAGKAQITESIRRN